MTVETQWIYRDYNHPSVVMWSLSNEVRYEGKPDVYEQLNKQYAKVKELDHAERPIGAMSGSAWGFGTARLDTDFLDDHDYLGLWSPSWTLFENNLKRIIGDCTDTYGDGEELGMPFVIWECVGYSWGQISDPGFTLNDIDKYATYVERPTNHSNPNGIGFAGTLGLETALDSDKGNLWGKEIYGKRIMETIRFCQDEVQGFAPWFQDHTLDAATLWNQPLYFGLRMEGDIPPRNIFAGETYHPNLFIVNSQNQEYEDLTLRLELYEIVDFEVQAEQGLLLGTIPVGAIAKWDKIQRTVKMELPLDLKPGMYQMRLMMFDADSKEVSRNFYNVYIQTSEILTGPITTTKKVAVWQTNSDLGESFISILDSLEVPYTIIEQTNALAAYDVLFVPPSGNPYNNIEYQELINWVESGGELVQLEQNYGAQTPLKESPQDARITFVDVIMTNHPIFKGLTQANFDTWNNPDYGFVINYGQRKFTKNALAVRGPLLGQSVTYDAVTEGKLGQGQIVTTQLCATSLWGIDSAATTFLRNILEYKLAPGEGGEVTSMRAFSTDYQDLEIDQERALAVDMRPFTNKGFKDEVAGDGKGGWTDQGSNDLRTMPLGRQVLCGVPFEIIDPATNNDTSCIILGGAALSHLPSEVEIPVEESLTKLFFLHTMAWGPRAKLGEYVVNYADGSQEKVVLEEDINIGDWWNVGTLPEAKLGITIVNPMNRTVGLWIVEWNNPHPEREIRSIEFKSYGNAVPILLAITGESTAD